MQFHWLLFVLCAAVLALVPVRGFAWWVFLGLMYFHQSFVIALLVQACRQAAASVSEAKRADAAHAGRAES